MLNPASLPFAKERVINLDSGKIRTFSTFVQLRDLWSQRGMKNEILESVKKYEADKSQMLQKVQNWKDSKFKLLFLKVNISCIITRGRLYEIDRPKISTGRHFGLYQGY